MEEYRQFAFKKFGYFDFNNDILEHLARQDYNSFVKIVFLKAGGNAVIDFTEYKVDKDALFFIIEGQHYKFNSGCVGTMIYYNRDFYCVEIHDNEVACDGILFHNVYEIPVVYLNKEDAVAFENTLVEVKKEFELEDSSMQ